MVDILIPILLIALSSVAALLSLESKSLVYGAISLAIFFVGLSLFFFYLGLPYLAIFQLAIYVGAIAVLIMFAVMVVGEGGSREPKSRLVIMGILGVVSIVSSLYFAVSYFGSVSVTQGSQGFNMSLLSSALINQYGLLIVVLGLLLSSAAFGAVALARREAEET
jgi:NADH:ubiquinone oxidoreductase subunit 6 (subunit J)